MSENNYKNGRKVEPGIWENLKEDGTHDGTYSVRISRRFKVDSVRTSHQLFFRRRRIASLSLARKEKRKLEDKMASKALKLTQGDKSWKDARDQFQKYLEARLEDKSIAYSTYDNMTKTLEKHTVQWDRRMLSWFNIEVFETYLNHADLKKDISITTRKNILKFIRQVFKRQIAIGAINHNPTNGVHVRKAMHEIDHIEADKEPVVMSKEDFYKVLDYAKVYFPDWAEVYAVGFWSGLRSGELYSLKWNNVVFDPDPKKCRVDVKTSYDWKTERVIQMTKGKKDRVVPMNKELIALLKELKLKSNSEFVLPRIQDWRNGKAAEVIRNMQEAVGVQKTKFHAIRGSFCTALLLAGVAPIIVQKIMGHSSFKTTQYYISIVGMDLAGATDVLGRAIHSIDDARKKKTSDQ